MIRLLILLILLLPSLLNAQPSSYDWRDVGGVNYVSAVRNQNLPGQDFGTCLAHSVTAALESKAIISGVVSRANADFAEQIFASCCYLDGEYCGGAMWGRLPQMMQWIRDYGLPLESCSPYQGWGFYNGYTCGSYACSNYLTNVYRVSSYTQITSVTVANLKSAIYNYGPIIAEFTLFYSDFTDFFSSNPTGIYSYRSGSDSSGHAVLVVGYNDTGSYFICKNSYGSSFADSGFFKIAYSQLGSPTYFGNASYYLGTAYYTGVGVSGGTISGGKIQ